MKVSVVLTFFLISGAFAQTERNVYPSSGPTDAKVDTTTDIDGFSNNPIDQGAGEQKMESTHERDQSDFKEGPYDREGKYDYLPTEEERESESP